MKILKIVLLSLLAIISTLGVYVYWQVSGLKVEQVTPDLHVIYGLGGNVGVLKTGSGAVVIDTMTFNLQGDLIKEKAEELTGEPVAMLINSHYHSDHTHGNPAFAKGTRVVATERTLQHLTNTDAEYFSDEAAMLLPNETFETREVIRLGNKTLHVIHPGRGHTDGDLVVFIEEDKTIHMGDLFFNRLYPNIDLEAGGSILDWGDSIDQVLSFNFEHIIPGHGPLAKKEELLQFQRFIRQLANIGQKAAGGSVSLEKFQSNSGLTEDDGYGEIVFVVPLGLNREFVLRRSWEEATGNYTTRD